MNDRLPLEGVFPMHCSANVGPDGDVAIFFGLSGTGKTTLSADPARSLIGDDEHGWGKNGVFNVEGGCYAKVIRLSAEAEPDIFRTTHTFGTILENVTVDERGVVDLDDDSKTENTRAAYELEQIPNAHPSKMAGHPAQRRVPHGGRVRHPAALARLSREQAQYWFLSGFTAKLAGTEIGVTEPQPTFSTCFGQPFMPQRPSSTRRMLADKLEEHGASVWLVNTGWTGGAVRRGAPDADRCDARAARGRALRRRSTRRSTGSTPSSASRFRLPSRRRERAARPALDLVGPGGVRREGRRARGDVPRELRGAFRCGRRARGRRGRPAARLSTLDGLRSVGLPGLAVTADRLGSGGDGRPFDVLVVGAGCAGMRAAIEAHDAGARVAVVSKLHPTRSHSGAAEGGINAALGNKAEDNPETHAFDTVKGSDYLGDQDAIEIFTREAPGDIYQLEQWGCVFSRNAEGKLDQRPFGAAGSPRTVYSADITGHVLIQVLFEQLSKRMEQGLVVFEEYFAFRLVEDDGRCTGVVCWDLLNGGVKVVLGSSTILATGGMGRLYRATTNAYACTGDGMAMALRAGLPLKDMEFMQFHPTTMYPSGILITEGCRGEGGFLINKDGERFMKRYAPNALELASRDVVSRSETTEIEAGRGVNGSVMLDLRHLGPEKIMKKLPGSRDLAITYAGVDPIYEPIPVRPGAHYHMGGVQTDEWGLTELEGSTPPARSRASPSTARTGWAATR